MIYRRDLIDHFQWLAGSKYFDEVIDEALVAIALTGYDHGDDMIQNGAWQDARGVVNDSVSSPSSSACDRNA